MPRSKNDPYKRSCAQAINHIANAILDINSVYEAFDKQAEEYERNKDTLAIEGYVPPTPSHREMADELKTAMLGMYACQQAVIKFVGDAWGLDEDRIKVYAG